MYEILKMILDVPNAELIIAVVVFIVIWAIKKTTYVNRNLLPLVSLLVGTLIGAGLGMIFNSMYLGAVEGLIAGGFASGGYDALRGLFASRNENEAIQFLKDGRGGQDGRGE